MPYTAHTVWPLPPNWDKGVLERLEWKTDILTSETAEEHRTPRRLTPRRSFEVAFLLSDARRRVAESILAGQGAATLLIPVWQDVALLSAAATAGTNLIPIDTRWREYRIGGLVILRNPRTLAWEVGTVAAISDSSLTLISNLENSWSAGTYCHPAKLAKIVEHARSGKKTDRASELTVRFDIVQANPHESLWLPLDYRGTPIYDLPPDESEDLSVEYQRMLASVDTALGLVEQVDTAGRHLPIFAYRWGISGRQKLSELREILYYLRGKNRSIWLPSFMDDLRLVAPVDTFDTTISVTNTGYTEWSARGAGRQDLHIVLHDGFVIDRRIIGSAVVSDSVETLTLDAPAFSEFAVSDVKHMFFITLCRLDNDTIEFSHKTDTDGLTQCNVVFKAGGPGTYWMTSRVYPASLLDSMDSQGVLGPLGAFLGLPLIDDRMDAAGTIGSVGEIRTLLLLYPYWSADSMEAAGSLGLEGTIRTLLLFYNLWPADSVDAFGNLTGTGTLRTLLITYTLWPADSMDAAGSIGLTGTLT